MTTPMPRIKKRVMLVCGSGIVSSTLVFPVVEEILKESGYRFELIKGTFSEFEGKGKLDLILTTVSPLPKKIVESGIPVVVVTPLFRGDRQAVEGKILSALKQTGE